MFRRFWLKNGVVPMVAMVATLSMLSYDAQAQVKPFKITGEGVASFGLPFPGQPARAHIVEGTATHLGKHHGAGSIQTNSVAPQPDGSLTGEFESGQPFVFTGANGDILSCNYGRTDLGASTPGTFTLIPVIEPGVYMAIFVAEFVPISADCTGKFKGVTGSWVMYAATEPFVLGSTDPIEYAWEGSGELTFKKEK